MRQTRREERSLVTQNLQRATQAGGFLAVTLRAGPILASAALKLIYLAQPNDTRFALLEPKWVSGGGYVISVNRP